MAASTAATRVAVITGAGTGIGRALALKLAAEGIHVLAVGRRESPLADLEGAAPAGAVTRVVADVTTAAGCEAIAAAAKTAGAVDFVVQNAGTIGPIARLEGIGRSAWEATFAVNVHGPVFLLQALQPLLRRPGARVLHVGSGAASGAVGGWTAYCASKAAFLSVYRCLSQELRPQGVHVGSVRPGIVDTPMQVEIRSADEAAMPDVGFFRGLHEKMGEAGEGRAPPSGCLDSPENAGAFLRFLLLEAGEEEFAATEWDIRDASHHGRWTRT